MMPVSITNTRAATTRYNFPGSGAAKLLALFFWLKFTRKEFVYGNFKFFV